MFTRAELVEFVDDIVHLVTVGVEDNGELSFILLHIHEQSPEGWDDIVFAFVEESCIHFALSLQSSLLSLFLRVDIFLLFSLLFLFLIFLGRHAAIFANAKLLACTLWQSELLQHLFELVLEFRSSTTWSGKLCHQF